MRFAPVALCLLAASPARADLSAADALDGARSILARALATLARSYGPPERPASSPGAPAPAPPPAVYFGSAGSVRAALSSALLEARGDPAEETLYVKRPLLRRIDRAFRAAFGRRLVRRVVRGRAEYDAAGLAEAFRRVYVRPEARIGPVAARDLYPPLRGFVAGAAHATASLLDDPARLAATTRAYDAAGGFDYERVERDYPGVDVFDVITVGVVWRRRLDGTLPVLVGALRTVLQDYDPQTFAELDRRLRVRPR